MSSSDIVPAKQIDLSNHFCVMQVAIVELLVTQIRSSRRVDDENLQSF